MKSIIYTTCLAVLPFLFQPQTADAASGNWTVDAGGSWNIATNWSPAVVPGITAGDVVGLNYNITAARIVTNNTTVTLGILNIGSTANTAIYTLTNGSGNTFTFNNSGIGAQLNELSTSKGDTMALPFVLSDNLAVSNSSGNTFTLAGIISGSKALTIDNTGTGLVNLTGANTFTGGITNLAGLMGISQGPNLGATPASPTPQLTFGGNSTLQFEASIAAGSAISVNRTFQINSGVNAAIDLNGFSIFTKNQWKSVGTGLGLFEDSSATSAVLYLGNNSGEADNSNFGAMVASGATVSLNRASSSSIHSLGGNGLTLLGGTVQLGGSGGDQIYDGASVAINLGTFDTVGMSETIGSLSGLAGTVTNSGIVASTLTIGGTLGTGAGYYQGNLRDNAANGGTLSLVKAGTGTLILGGTNTYAGSTTISNGTLQLQPTPVAPYATNLVYQLDASILGLTNGASVTSVPDGSGNGNTVTPYAPANPPTYNTVGLNGKGTIHFTNNASVGLQTAGNFSISSNSPRSVFAVMFRPSGGQILLSWGNTSGGNLFDVTIGNNGLFYLPAVYSGGDNTYATPVVDVRAHLCEALYDGNVTESGYLDGNLLGTKTIGSALNTTAAPLQIGYRSGDGNKALGDVAEILIYNAALTTSQRQQVEAYLLNKWFGKTGGPSNVLPISTTVNLAGGASLDLNGTPQTLKAVSDISGAGGLVTNSSATTPVVLILAPTGLTNTFSGVMADNGGVNALSLKFNGASATQMLAGTNTYHGSTTINGGILALSTNGSIANSTNLYLNAGASFDVSAIAIYNFAGTTLTASGTGTNTGSTAATLKGGSTLNLGSGPVFLNFTPTAFLGDSTHPALSIASGALNLGSGAITVSNNGSSPLGAGDYILINGGTVSGSPKLATNSGVGAGAGLAIGTLPATLVIANGNLVLHVSTSLSASTTSIALNSPWTSSSTYGNALQFNVTVSGYTPTGTINVFDGGAGGILLGSGTLSNAAVTITLNPLNSLAAGTHTNLVAVYGGDVNNAGGVSPALTPAQVVSGKGLSVAGAAAQNKYYDGTATATISGTLSGILSGDTVTLNGTGTFASTGAGTGIAVTSASTLGGASAGNYLLTQPTGLTANIYASGVWTGAAADTLWNTASNWSAGQVPGGANVTADFSTLDILTNQTVNLSSQVIIGNLIFGDQNPATAAGWTLANSGTTGNTLTLAGTAPTVTVNALGAGSITTVSATVAGSAGLTKAGSGTLALTAANSYTGGTTLSSGTLQFRTDSNLGSSNSAIFFNGGTLASAQTAEVTMTRTLNTGTVGGTLQLNGGSATNSINEIQLYTTGQITGSGPLTVTGTGFISIGSANTGFSGGWNLNSGLIELVNNLAAGSGAITVNSGAELSTLGCQITNALTLNGGTISWDYYTGSGNYKGPLALQSGGGTVSLASFYVGGGSISGTIGGNISGNGGLTTTATGPGSTAAGGTLTLSGTNNYTGGTTIGLGTTVIISNGMALGSNANTLSVAGNLNLNGNSLSQGTLNLSGGATFDFNLGSGGVNGLSVGNASVSGTNYIGLTVSGLAGAGTYNLISSTNGGLTGAYLFTGGTNAVLANDAFNDYFLLTLSNTDTAEMLIVTQLQITNAITIMPFGSSITAGQSAQTPYEGGGYRTGLYLDLVADGRFTPGLVGSSTDLLANSPTNVNPLTTANQLHHEGHPGWTTTMMLANINANDGNSGGDGGFWLAPSNGVNPNYIPVNIGGNDAVDYGTNFTSMNLASGRLDAIISDFNALRPGVNTIISSICYRGDGSGAYSVGLDSYYNPAVEGLVYNHVLSGQSVRFLDLRTIMNYPSDIGSDLIHPTQDGYAKMANAWYQSLIYGGAYWTGNQNSVWNTVNGNSSNWSLDPALAYNRQKSLNDASTIVFGIYPDIFFNSNTNPLSTSLGTDTTIRSLNFTMGATGPVTIGAGNTLTIGTIDTNVVAGNLYTAMNSGGITVQAGSGAHILAANVVLGAAQNWGNVSTNALTVSGSISGTNALTIVGGYTLFYPGTFTPNPTNNTTYETYTTVASNYASGGVIVLSGNNLYSGGTMVNSGTLLVTGQASPNSGTGSGAVMVNAGGTLSGNGRIAGNVMIANTASAVLYPNNSGGGILALGGNLTLGGNNSGVMFNLSANSASGNDQVALMNTILACGGARITINAASGVLSAADYVLFDAGSSGMITSNFNSTPAWSGITPKYAAQYSVVTVGNTVVLRYTPIAIRVSAAASTKNYDGTTNSTTAPIIVSGTLAAGDRLQFVESYSDKNIGTGKNLSLGGLIADVSSNNVTARYTITLISTNTGVINQTNLTLTAVTDSKTYDGTILSSGVPIITSGAIQTGDSAPFLTQTFDLPNAGPVNARSLIPAGRVVDGNGGSNYNYTYVTTPGTINPASLTITANDLGKLYGQNILFAGTEFSESGLISGDTATNTSLASLGATNNAAVGSYPITVTAAMGSGLSNYTINYVSGTLTVNPAPNPVATNIVVVNGTAIITFAGAAAITYVTQSALDFTGVWNPISTNTPGTNGIWTVTDTNAGGTQKFYRAQIP